MMHVWLVERVVPYESSDPIAIFSTKEAAEAFADERQKKDKHCGYHVHEFEVDKVS